MYNILKCIALFLIFFHPSLSFAGSTSAKEHVRDLHKIIDSYHRAIVNKDKNLFLSVFSADAVSWVSVNDRGSLARQNAALPEGGAQKRFIPSSHLKFIDGIVRDPVRIEEKVSGVKIFTDGNIAQINYDYVVDKGKAQRTAWGKEAWQLINTDDGWKIVSVIWSAYWKAPPVRKEVVLPPELLEQFAGSYAVRPDTSLDITVQGNHLVAKLGSQQTLILFPESRTVFFDKTWGSTTEFVRDSTGRVTHIVIRENGSESEAPRL